MTAITMLATIIGFGFLVGFALLALILVTDLIWPIVRDECAARLSRYRLWRNDCGYTAWRAFWEAVR